MIIYELLTLAITCLNRLRTGYAMAFLHPCFRPDRDLCLEIEMHCIDTGGLILECCDCGLTHLLRLTRDRCLHIIPIRPRRYRYRLRLEIKPEPKL